MTMPDTCPWPPANMRADIEELHVNRMDLEDLAAVLTRGDQVTAAHLAAALHLAGEYEQRDAYERKIEALNTKIRRAADVLLPPAAITGLRSTPPHGTPAYAALLILLS
jgi:hypothetical protein